MTEAGNSSPTPSLLLLSLPRSLSSQAWLWARASLGLAAPAWASDGEVLNLDRFSFGSGAHARHFLRPEDGEAFTGALALFHRMIESEGYAYKDVTQPFVVARWLADNPERCRVLRVRRPLADIALAMLDKGWTYPAALAPEVDEPEDALIDGLIVAREALDAVPALDLAYDDLINDEDALRVSLEGLYGIELAPHALFDHRFMARRDDVLARRKTSRYQELQARVLARLERHRSRTAAKEAPRPTRFEIRDRQRPRLLVVGDANAPTGFARVTASVLEHLAARYEIHQLGIKYRGGPHDLPWTLHPTTDSRGLGELSELCAALEPDLVWLVNDVWVLGDYVTALDPVLRAGQRPRVVAYCPVESAPLSPAFLAALRGVDRLVAYTSYGQRVLEQAAARLDEPPSWSAIDQIPHGIDTETFHPLASLSEDPVASRRSCRAALFGHHQLNDAFIVLNANRNQPRKRIDITVEGFAAFAHERPDAYLYLHMGTEDVGWNLRALADHFGVSNRLIISLDQRRPPRLTTTQLNHVYNACDVGVNTSSSEGWGLTAFEHAATGAAQIVPAHTSPAELWSGAAEHVDVGMRLCQPRVLTEEHLLDAHSLTAALTRLYEDRDLLRTRARQAHALATSPALSWAAVARRWAALFDEELA